ncbi:DNA-binding MarR family transcriptional regulator [Antricoccus suffuscus]|uniref:DNA-binding MarR family transcriptional regulator n=1 Tax=Antricoccus suffuscus TaxID=1629062 RepID=A0A2T0ZX86_9ACTN|nr:MarR family transcriptional regulator [Antricoccus suffuscus]PRZ40969.1 DNA-binding MarR family transcriptional regulator [Antricoccus suffuscus]
MTITKTTPVAVWLNLHALVMDHKWLSRDLLHDRTDGMPWSGYRVLRRVEDDPRSQGEIADLMGIDAPAVSGIVADLLARGYVGRTTDPADGRRKLVRITDSGREVLENLRGVTDVAPAPVASLTAPERRELTRLIDKMRAASDRG